MGNILFQNALKNQNMDRPPIWFMRQAGRYHSHYQELKKVHTFEQLCKNPSLAAETALGPINDFNYDVAILFSDILFILESLGMNLHYNPGPIFEKFFDESQINNIKRPKEVAEDLLFQYEAISLTRKQLPQSKSLVGFVGGPWTLASYATGMNKEQFLTPNFFHEKLVFDILIPALKENISLQLQSGAEVVYMFDTNAVQLEKDYFCNRYLKQIKQNIFDMFPKKIAYFSKNKNLALIEDINEKFSLSGFVHNPERNFTKSLKNNKSGFVQGNFPSESLAKPHIDFKKDFKLFCNRMKRVEIQERLNWVCSLNHGVLPKTPEENVRYFIDYIREKF